MRSLACHGCVLPVSCTGGERYRAHRLYQATIALGVFSIGLTAIVVAELIIWTTMTPNISPDACVLDWESVKVRVSSVLLFFAFLMMMVIMTTTKTTTMMVVVVVKTSTLGATSASNVRRFRGSCDSKSVN